MLTLTLTLIGCGGGGGGGGGSSSENNGSQENPKKDYYGGFEFSGYFGHSKGELQTTEEFNQEQAKRLAEISDSTVRSSNDIISSYDADSETASFRIHFDTRTLDNYEGPTLYVYSNSNTSTIGGTTRTTNTSKILVFTNKPKELDFYSYETISVECAPEEGPIEGTNCYINVKMERDRYALKDFSVDTHVNVDRLDSETVRYTSGNLTFSSEYLPVSNLNSITLLDSTGTKIATLLPST
jgi:hypothetical protein